MHPVIGRASGVHVVVGRQRYVSFGGCDSLGLARHPEVVGAARSVLTICGLGATASRTTTGTWSVHVTLERDLARWLGAEDAVILPSGWMAAAALASALAAECDVALLDAGAHPALAAAARTSGLPVREFAHFDARAANRAASGEGRPLLLVDAVDLAHGRVAPLQALARLAASARGHVVVDDAHGIGVLGPHGRGTAAALRASGPRVHTAGSLSKALGGHGGFVVGKRSLCERVRRGFDAYSGATPIPPSIAAAASVAVRFAADDALRERMRENAALLARRFREIGLATPRAGTPWFAVGAARGRDLAAISNALRGDGLLVPYITYFGAPPGGWLKIAVSAAHEVDHVERLAEALARHVA
jgi:8-amino-7-oxononanoate synthase